MTVSTPSGTRPDRTETPYRAALAVADITPSGTVPTQGFLRGSETSGEARSPLLLHALLLEDARGEKLLLARADLFGFSDEMVELVRGELRRWGLPPEAILLNASHTHYAPGTTDSVLPAMGPYQPEYARSIARALVETVPELYDRLEPCQILRGLAHGQIGVNRTGDSDNPIAGSPRPDGYYHRATPMLVLNLRKTDRQVLLLSHGCHPTGIGDLTGVTGDYPVYLRSVLLQSSSLDEVLFFQGPGGTSKQIASDGDAYRWATEEAHVKNNAYRLAGAVSRGLQRGLELVEGPLYARRASFELPIDCAHPRRLFEELLEREDSDPWERQWGRRCLDRFDPEDSPATYHLSYETHLVALGEDTVFLSFPGEPAGELARKILDRYDLEDDTFVLGYTNGLHSYLPTADLIERGTYEARMSQKVYGLPGTFRPETGKIVTRAVGENLAAWRRSDEPNGYGRFHLLDGDAAGEAFFCLSTGRCGTKTLSRVLNTAENARVYHHPRPFLVEETLAAYHHTIDRKATFRRARGTLLRDAWKDGLRFGEVDHNMTPFAPAIDRELPAARFVVLVRNPWGFVRSGMRRGYYRGHTWDVGRLRPEDDHPDAGEWIRWSAFEKVCWLWADTYRRIGEYLETIPENRTTLVRFEDLVEGPAASRRLFDRLELEEFSAERIEAVLGRKLNAQKSGEFPRPEEWSGELHRVLWNRCRDTVERLELDSYSEMAEAYAARAAASSNTS